MVAKELGGQISVSTVVDTIVCIDGCEIIGAFLAEELTRAGVYSMNAHNTIYIITPEYANSGQILFRENYIPMIKGKNVLLLLASATTGQTIVKVGQALSYYGATISGISAVFSAANSAMGIPIKSLFTIADIPDYKAFNPEGCSLCKEKQPIDALANGFGYSRIS
ncbi:MAG: orotate phosphoribosyltransferase [Lachnospiraceae bacterium]|nr:orotate phosphoribosyltransferase [Lachnospiraceae bacterium]